MRDAALRRMPSSSVLWAAWDLGLGTAGSSPPRSPGSREPRVSGLAERAPRHAIRQNGRAGLPSDGSVTSVSERTRHILVVAHTGRADSLDGRRRGLPPADRGRAVPVLAAATSGRPARGRRPSSTAHSSAARRRRPAGDLELVIVLGGDGTILRAAELGAAAPRRCSASTSATSASSPRASAKTSPTTVVRAPRRATTWSRSA